MGMPTTKLYLIFIQNVLPLFSKANTLLQQESPFIHKLQRELVSLYSDCLSRFIKPCTVLNADNIYSIDFCNRSLQKAKDDLVIGSKTRQYLKDTRLTGDEIKQFYRSVRAFYEKACSYMLKKFPLQDDILRHAAVADVHTRSETKFSSLQFFLNLFGNDFTVENTSTIEAEFAAYQIDKLNDDILKCERADMAWNKIKHIVDHNSCTKYESLAKLMLNILLLPHSNAVCERIFSTIKKNQNEFRANLGINTLEALIIEKCKLSSQDMCCYQRNFTEEELRRAKAATNLALTSNKS